MKQVLHTPRIAPYILRGEGAKKLLEQRRTIQRVGERAAGKATDSRSNLRYYLLVAGAAIFTFGLMGWAGWTMHHDIEQRRKERERVNAELIFKLDQLSTQYMQRTMQKTPEQERIERIINSRPSGSGSCCPGMR